MNRKTLLAAMLASVLAPLAAQAADVGVSVSVGEPGFYGRIDIGNYPRPQVIYDEPVIVRRAAVRPAPVYLRVPPGHEKNWAKHCSKYDACGRPVYFVRDSWYNDVYVPAHREHSGYSEHGGDHGGHGGEHGGGHGGPGKGHGKGHGKGRD